MRGEDKIFLMEVVLATLGGGDAFIRFMANEQKVDRILAIRNELGRDGFDAELIKLKEEMTYEDN
jgi:chitinase